MKPDYKKELKQFKRLYKDTLDELTEIYGYYRESDKEVESLREENKRLNNIVNKILIAN